MDLPTIERIPPELPSRREIIRRNPGYDGGFPCLIKEEQLWVRPDIGAVMRHKNRDIADDLDSLVLCIGA